LLGQRLYSRTTGDIAGPILGYFLYGLYRFRSFDVGGLVLPGYGLPFYVNAVLGIAATIFLMLYVQESRSHDTQAQARLP
jgi:MFS family permease